MFFKRVIFYFVHSFQNFQRQIYRAHIYIFVFKLSTENEFLIFLEP